MSRVGCALAALALVATPLLGAEAGEPTYLLCSAGEVFDERTADPVMLDRDGGLVVWMRRAGGGEWRRTSYAVVATTPSEVSASAARGGDDLHVTVDVERWEFEREWPRPRAENASVWDAHNERLGIDGAQQLYVRERGRCRVQE